MSEYEAERARILKRYAITPQGEAGQGSTNLTTEGGVYKPLSVQEIQKQEGIYFSQAAQNELQAAQNAYYKGNMTAAEYTALETRVVEGEAAKQFASNISVVTEKYSLNENGYFGDKGKNCRVIKCSDPVTVSAEFYEIISRGGKEIALPNGKGVQTVFADNTRIVYRIYTSTEGSPAIEIRVIGGTVKQQKIHFIIE